MTTPAFNELKFLVRILDLPVPFVAREAGVDVDSVRRLLNGGTPRIGTAVRLARFVGKYMILTPRLQKMVRFYGEKSAAL